MMMITGPYSLELLWHRHTDISSKFLVSPIDLPTHPLLFIDEKTRQAKSEPVPACSVTCQLMYGQPAELAPSVGQWDPATTTTLCVPRD